MADSRRRTSAGTSRRQTKAKATSSRATRPREEEETPRRRTRESKREEPKRASTRSTRTSRSSTRSSTRKSTREDREESGRSTERSRRGSSRDSERRTSRRDSRQSTRSSSRESGRRSARRTRDEEEGQDPSRRSRRGQKKKALPIPLIGGIAAGVVGLILIALFAFGEKSGTAAPKKKAAKQAGQEWTPGSTAEPYANATTARRELSRAHKLYGDGNKQGGAEGNRMMREAVHICDRVLATRVKESVVEDAGKLRYWASKGQTMAH